jgi:hypothetical protein
MSNHGGNAVTGMYQMLFPPATDFAPPLIGGPGTWNELGSAVLSATSFCAAAIPEPVAAALDAVAVLPLELELLLLELLLLEPQAATARASTAASTAASVALRTRIVVSLL